MRLKVLFVFNNNKWSTIPQKITEIKAFFAQKIEIVPTIIHTNFTNIPFTKIQVTDGTGSQDGTDHIGESETVADWWYNQNLSIPYSSYDIIVFCISDTDKMGHITSSGIRLDKDQGPVETVIFGGREFDNTYVNGINIGNNFVIFTAHEMAHAIYMILGRQDNTHKYFYSGQPQKVLEDFNNPPVPNIVDRLTILQKLLAAFQSLLKLQNQLDALPKSNKIDLFCKAIERHEGYYPPKTVFKNGIDQYPKGSVAWRNKNPFNLRYVGQPKAIGKDSNNFAIFANYEDGFAAGKQMVLNACTGKSKIYSPEDTIFQFFSKYAPSFENNTLVYAQAVAKACGVSIDTKIKDLL